MLFKPGVQCYKCTKSISVLRKHFLFSEQSQFISMPFKLDEILECSYDQGQTTLPAILDHNVRFSLNCLPYLLDVMCCSV